MAERKSSRERVLEAAARASLSISVMEMPASTRTAAEAAEACGCSVAEIVKSLVFCGAESGRLVLLLVSGAKQVDLAKAAEAIGEPLARADPKAVRATTGFAIGGVAPIGHLTDLPTWIDESLLGFKRVWAAAGAPTAVFAVAPRALQQACGASVLTLA
ncbi:MAG: YbaK/EbsC family protein [Rhodospirillales bacterium]